MTLKRRLARIVPFSLASEAIYPRSYFREVEEEQGALYARLAELIHQRWAPQSVIDIGCGTGMILSNLARYGVDVRGVDGSRSAINASSISDRILRWNLERPLPELGKFDLAICTEVAEHLPANVASELVSQLVSLSDVILFTAATPGQGGRHHLNEQPHSYWVALFAQHGFTRNPGDEAYLLEGIADIRQALYVHDNLMAFRNSGA